MARKKKTVPIDSSSSINDDIKSLIESENLGEENESNETYTTGIDMVDYRLGRVEEDELALGINGGKIFTIVGKSGSGKTTLALQSSLSIINQYEEAQLIHLDFENASSKARTYSLARELGIPKEKLKKQYIYLNKGIYTETLYKLTKATANLKLSKYDSIKIDTGRIDNEGNTIYALPPTIILVDSWASVIPKDISEEEELSGQMSATSIARTNNAVIKRLAGCMGEANIIMIVINHLTKKVEIGPIKSSADLNYLAQDESSPGGTSIIYLADSLIKVIASSKLEEDKDYGIKGFIVTGIVIKSRSNEAGRKFELIFSQSEGFDNFYTNFHFLKKEKFLKGAGRGYYFDFAPDIKFTQKDAKSIYLSNEEWREEFDKLVEEVYYNFISTKGYTEEMDEDDETEEEDIELIEKVGKKGKKKVYLGSDDNYYLEDGTLVEEDEIDFDD